MNVKSYLKVIGEKIMCNEEQELRKFALPLLKKWSLFILLNLVEKGHSFVDLERAIPDISRKVLTENLRQLATMAMINKYGETSTGFPIKYELSSLRESLLPVFYELKKWFREHRNEINKHLVEAKNWNGIKESKTSDSSQRDRFSIYRCNNWFVQYKNDVVHREIFILPILGADQNPLGYILAIVIGTIVAAGLALILKGDLPVEAVEKMTEKQKNN